ncbi:MAG: hypothetical protein QF440_04700, partial [Candidatus Thalassarchaeaceae archaeon]|nr:hypothetical protein [Candidatus Thalassarchaeaceae archaeon]
LGSETHPRGVAYDSTSDAVVVTGAFATTLSIEGSQNAVVTSGNWEVFVLGISSSGIDSWLTTIGGNGYDYGYDLAINSDGIVFVVGETEGAFRASGLQVSGSQGHFDIMVGILAPDYDGDGTPDLTDLDDDGDMLPDVVDNCAFSPFGFASSPILDHDGDGCRDSDEDDDDDGDSIVDILDSCPIGVTGWISSNLTDIDSDGCSDAMEDLDDDADGVNDSVDLCPTVHGNSTYEFEEGCPDSDGDGRPDIRDEFGDDPTEWSDIDNDEVGDNADAFPMDFTQQNDTDGDGHGDNPYGTQGDWFPDDPTRWADADRDGVADEDDAFVNDATQWNDTDGDGHGDELAGNQGDAFPEDPEEWQDSDSDNVGNNADDFPFDPSQQTDSDGDGFGDNPLGSGADKFPDDPSQWSDIDGDGFGDNQTGTDADVFIADPTQHSDRDGDGYGDSLSGRLADLFPDNPTQWIDQDGDGLGDNLSGTDADPYLFDFDNDGYNDSIDILPKLSSPGDHDNDGCPDLEDLFPLDYKECSNFDGDEEGDNADTDDDNDGWTDTDEVRLGTDPNDPDDYPIDSFELQIPGTAIGLGAWDLIGIFGGVPLFAWIGFGFVTRNTRCRKFESMLRDANTPKELEKVALKWEYSLMLRLLGPHQGIRLERLRSELDDAMAGETHHIPEHIEPEDITEDQTHIVEDEMVTGVAATGPSKDITGRVAEDGYEWTMFEGVNYYRMPNSGDDWKEWQG